METSYYKLMPNVFLAKTNEPCKAGDVIEITTKRGKVNEHIIHKLYAEKGGYYYYSQTRADGVNCQTRAQSRAERRKEWADSSRHKSSDYFKKSQKDREFLSLGEPIKVGHHSEKRHRKIIEQSWGNMGKSVEYDEKAKEHLEKASYWEEKAKDINLSMPESVDYFSYMLEAATLKHADLKKHPEKRKHSFSLTYAKKEMNDLKKKVEIANKLWAEEPQIDPVEGDN